MPEKYTNTVYVLFALAAISGGLGGCAVAGHRLITGKKMRFSFFAAYAIVGAAFGLLFAAYGFAISAETHPVEIIGPSIMAGVVGAAALGSMNWTARIVLKHLGIEVQVTMRKTDEDRRKGDEGNAQ